MFVTPTHYATGAIPISLLYLCLSSSMLTRISSVTALGINGVRTFYGKTIPDHTLKWEYPILFSNRFVQVFHRHGDRTPLHNYLQGSPQEKDEIQMWKQLVRSLSLHLIPSSPPRPKVPFTICIDTRTRSRMSLVILFSANSPRRA